MSRKLNQLFHESHSWKREIVFQNVQVTPELAGELLRMNGKNRPVNNATVKRYANDMTKGKWHNNGDVLRISKTGMLLDGQHRIMAVLESGVTITQHIATGIEDSAFDVIDIGRQRSAADAVAVKGFSNYNVIAGATKMIMAYKSGGLKKQNQGHTGRERFSNADVIEYIEKQLDSDLIQEAATAGNKLAHKAKFFSPSTYAAFFYIFAEIDREAATLFFDLLTTGENIGKNNYSMIFLLRKKLIDFQMSNATLNTLDKYALLIKSWNFYRVGKEIAQLSWQSKEDFPVISTK